MQYCAAAEGGSHSGKAAIDVKIRLASSAGFCFGVNRAVNLVRRLLDEGAQDVCTLGPIIHNPQIVAELEERGVKIITTPAEAPNGGTVVIRSHGVAMQIYDEIKKIGIKYADATCPFVSKIHKIVKDNSGENTAVLIAGNPEHPEVKGIESFCRCEAFIFNSLEELKKITEIKTCLKGKNIIVVSQTTFNVDEWSLCVDFIKKVYTNAIFFDTICDATSIRQQEAKEIAKDSDIMIIIGGKQSSNTAKLFKVCSEFCSSVLIENADELPLEIIKHVEKIGVTAGASTPARLIKEVLQKMAENDIPENVENQENEEISFAEAIENTIKTIVSGDKVKGTVVGFSPSEVQVDLGTKHAGYIPLSEFSDDPSDKPEETLKVGDEIDVVVLKVSDVDGTVMLSKKRVDSLKGWDTITGAFEEGSVLEGTVVEAVKGGVLVLSKGTKLFVPASQSGVPKSGSLESLLHQKVKFKIIDINARRKRAVGSISAVAREERKQLAEQFWNDIEAGKQYTGTVKSMTSYGAFVDLGGVDGMVHVSELSWQRIKTPSEVVKIGDVITVTVKDFDKDAKRVSLTYKKAEDNPWKIFTDKFTVGDQISVKIVNFTPFGAFAQIIPGVDGLIHISQISDERIAKPQDVLEIGQEVRVKIINIDEDKKRISLSMKEAGEYTDEAVEKADTAEEASFSSDQLGENA